MRSVLGEAKHSLRFTFLEHRESRTRINHWRLVWLVAEAPIFLLRSPNKISKEVKQYFGNREKKYFSFQTNQLAVWSRDDKNIWCYGETRKKKIFLDLIFWTKFFLASAFPKVLIRIKTAAWFRWQCSNSLKVKKWTKLYYTIYFLFIITILLNFQELAYHITVYIGHFSYKNPEHTGIPIMEGFWAF